MTLSDLLNEASLGLSCVAGQKNLHRSVTWVHTSEVSDPSPWLSADGLLLTTALVDRSDVQLRGFFASLASSGVAGVGFGVGLTHHEIPQTWIDAADLHQIPLLRVPLDTPYIAISELVARRRNDAQLAQITRMLNVHRALAHDGAAALSSRDVSTILGRELGCRIVWPEAEENVGTDTGDLLLSDAEAAFLSTELDQTESHSLSVSVGSLYIHITSVQGRRIAALRRQRFSPLEQNIIETTALLLSAKPAAVNSRLSRLLLSEAINGDLELPEYLWTAMFPDWMRCTVVCLQPEGSVDRNAGALATLLTDHNADQPQPPVAVSGGDCVYLITGQPVRNWADLPLSDRLGRQWRAGVSHPATPSQLPQLWAQAAAAAQFAQLGNIHYFTEADDRTELLRIWSLSTGDKPLTRDWISSLVSLAPGQRERMVDALQAFLKHNGALEKAANDLEIHRQTLNSRLRKAEDLLCINLDSPTDRALLWLHLSTGTLTTEGADSAQATSVVHGRRP